MVRNAVVFTERDACLQYGPKMLRMWLSKSVPKNKRKSSVTMSDAKEIMLRGRKHWEISISVDAEDDAPAVINMKKEIERKEHERRNA